MADTIKKKARGFTLIELMIVVAVLAIMASIAIPKYADMLLKATEGTQKGNLGSMRSALQIYYADMNGVFPSCAVGPNSTELSDALIPKYIPQIPLVKNGLHPTTNAVYCDYEMVAGSIHDGQGWYYDGAQPAELAAASGD